MVTNNFASFYSCGSVKHGWEKKWVVLADQMLQLYDKENMGGETVFRNPPILQGVYRNDKTLTFLFFRKFVTIRSTTLMWQRWSCHRSFRCHVIRIDRYRPYGSALHTKGGVAPEMLARSESLHLSAFIPSQTEMGRLFGVRLG